MGVPRDAGGGRGPSPSRRFYFFHLVLWGAGIDLSELWQPNIHSVGGIDPPLPGGYLLQARWAPSHGRGGPQWLRRGRPICPHPYTFGASRPWLPHPTGPILAGWVSGCHGGPTGRRRGERTLPLPAVLLLPPCSLGGGHRPFRTVAAQHTLCWGHRSPPSRRLFTPGEVGPQPWAGGPSMAAPRASDLPTPLPLWGIEAVAPPPHRSHPRWVGEWL